MSRPRLLALPVVIPVALAVALSGCSSSKSSSGTKTTGSAPTSSTAGGSPTITISGFAYSGDLTVKEGTKVTVVDKDGAAHTLTDKQTHKFDTGNIDGSGGTGSFTAPSTPGTYTFGCTYHPNMKGTLTVTS